MTINPTQDLVYPYLKLRREFGRQQLFLEDHGRVHTTVRPQLKHRKTVMKKANIGTGSQAVPGTCLSEMNTIRAEYNSVSLMHTEGGWPKDMNTTEPDIIARYRKKLEKDDGYQAAVPIMTDEMEEHIKYNNTINFYRDSYNCIPIGGDRDLVPSATVVNVYRNPAARPRAVSRITFAPDNAGRMAVAQCPFEFDPALREHTGEAFFWEVETPSRPEGLVRGPSHITDIRYHPKDLHSLIGSLFTGQVATWDARVSPNPQAISAYEVSHKDVCTSALWINSKTGTEFFSCGLDGQIIWWDERNLSEALDTVYCDPEKGQSRPEMAIGATVMEYEHTLPTKFLCGNEKGDVMVFMKKGKTPSDRMIHLYKAHKGPVRALHRNPMFIKNFLTVGDYHLRIFAEDCKESSIMWTVPSESLYTYANWLKTRSSGFVAGRMDGVLEFWDLLIQGAKNILTLQICDEPLTAVCAADGGKHVAVGTKTGDVRFVKLTDFMGEFEKNDKPLLAAVFDRESRREKYLEQRNREIRLKKRDQDKKEADNTKGSDDKPGPPGTPAAAGALAPAAAGAPAAALAPAKAGTAATAGTPSATGTLAAAETPSATGTLAAAETPSETATLAAAGTPSATGTLAAAGTPAAAETPASAMASVPAGEAAAPGASSKEPPQEGTKRLSVPAGGAAAPGAPSKEPPQEGTKRLSGALTVAAATSAEPSMNIREEALNDPVVKAEREFFLSIAEEIKSKGVGAFPDKIKKKEENKEEEGSTGNSRSSFHITAAELAAIDAAAADEDVPQKSDPKPKGKSSKPDVTQKGKQSPSKTLTQNEEYDEEEYEEDEDYEEETQAEEGEEEEERNEEDGRQINAEVQGTKSEKISATVSAKVSATVSATVSAPVSAKVSATVTAPVSATVSAPVSAKVSATVTAPVSATVSAPVSATVSATVTAPVTAPVSATVTAPVSATVTAPVSATVTAPVSATVSTAVVKDESQAEVEVTADAKGNDEAVAEEGSEADAEEEEEEEAEEEGEEEEADNEEE